MRVLITGATGYLGTAMLEAIPEGITAIPIGFSRGDRSVDVTEPHAVERAFRETRPEAVVHLAAMSRLESAANDPERAVAINAVGAGVVAKAAAEAGIRLVALSSDVVFDGASAPYDEEAEPRPINRYGESKLLAEQALAAAHHEPLIIRTSVLVGRERADRYPFSVFVLTAGRARQPIELFQNERRNFFPVTTAAAAVWECVRNDLTGLIHIAATGSASRYEFGRLLLQAAGLDPALAVPANGPADRPSDLTLTVRRAGECLRTRLPTMDEVVATTSRDMGVT